MTLSEKAEKGDYLLIEDPDSNRSLIAQVIDLQFASIPGVLEEFLHFLVELNNQL